MDKVEPDVAGQGNVKTTKETQGMSGGENGGGKAGSVKEELSAKVEKQRPMGKAEELQETPIDQELEEKSGHSSLSAFIAHPPGIFFADKEPEEQLILLLRAHLVTNVPWVIVSLILLVAPLVLVPVMAAAGILAGVGPGLIFVVVLFWYLGTFTYVLLNFLYWYFNVYIVTDERVIDVDWYSVIFRKVSSTQIVKIQDASALQSGVLAGIFDYGDVQIQTAGEEENFEFASVPHPQLVAKKIEELMQQEEKEFERNPLVNP